MRVNVYFNQLVQKIPLHPISCELQTVESEFPVTTNDVFAVFYMSF